ncbi:13207_t:CDS:1 [Funneliformis geosporum]|uniref:13207_t:CDS:1 n=1 Tax=Funneliformis geosporum TaxID=1117311 RepID=A0A9W4SR73_9GLOM|nr:13207_t:CDS:1 [Funneliformis geosporum]
MTISKRSVGITSLIILVVFLLPTIAIIKPSLFDEIEVGPVTLRGEKSISIGSGVFLSILLIVALFFAIKHRSRINDLYLSLLKFCANKQKAKYFAKLIN